VDFIHPINQHIGRKYDKTKVIPGSALSIGVTTCFQPISPLFFSPGFFAIPSAWTVLCFDRIMSQQLVAQKLAPVFGKDGDFTVVVEDTSTLDVHLVKMMSTC